MKRFQVIVHYLPLDKKTIKYECETKSDAIWWKKSLQKIQKESGKYMMSKFIIEEVEIN